MKKNNTSQEESKEIFRRTCNSLNLKALPFIYAIHTSKQTQMLKIINRLSSGLIIFRDS